MKRLALITISLVLAIGAAFAASAPVYAESETQYNPEEFVKTLVFTSLTDYAVSGQTYAFAEGNKLYVYSEGKLVSYTHTSGITALDAADGVFYYKDINGGVFSLPDMQPASHEFKTLGDGILSGSYLYFIKEGILKVSDTLNETFEPLKGYSNPKEYGGKVYAVKNNELHVLSGATGEKIDDMVYTQFPADGTILTGNTASALKENYALKFVTVKKDSFITEVDLSSLDGEFLKTGETVTVAEDFDALLLCRTGNAAVIANGDKSYLAKIPVEDEKDVSCFKTPAFEEATVTGSAIYASPFVVKGTSVINNAAGMPVKILHRLELEGVLGASFYEVKYTVDGQEHTGYVTAGLVTEYLFGENKEPTAVPDPAYSEKNNVKTVVLVLVVVILVLAAAGYLTYVGTNGKLKKKNKKNSGSEVAEDKN